MPLGQNPAFGQIMRAVDLIAADNMMQQRENRQEERQIAAEDRQNQRRDMEYEREMAQNEYNDLTSWINNYGTAVKSGMSPTPDILQSAVERRNELIKSGTAKPRQIMPQMQIGNEPQLYQLSDKATKAFGFMPENNKVDLNTKVEIEGKLLQNAIDRARIDKSGSGKTPPTPAEKASEEIARKIKKAEKYSSEGIKTEKDTDKVGVLREATSYYIENLRELNAQAQNNQWSDSLNTVLYNMPDFEKYYEDVKDTASEDDDLLNEVKKLLGGMKEIK